MIEMYRVDERVIHGQTTTRLTKEYPCDGVLIVDDVIAKDSFMMSVFKNVLPASIRVYGYTVETAARKLVEAASSQKHYYVVFKRTTTLKKLIEAGFKPEKTVYIGPQGVRENTTTLLTMCSLTKEEMEALDYAESQGVKVIVNPRFDTPNLEWHKLKEENKDKLC